MSNARQVVVVGSGLIGTATAYYLAQRDCRVTVLERGPLGAACSDGNCGLVCPSHVLPLAEPGAVKLALAALMKPSGPFSIRLRWDPSLWWWLTRFARRCNQRDMMAAAVGIHALLDLSRRLYDQLFEQDELPCEWETRGLLYAFRDRSACDGFAESVKVMREHFGVSAERYDGRSMQALEPALLDDVQAGWWFPGDAHLKPDRLLAGWRQLLSSRDVQFLADQEVVSIRSDADQLVAVTTRDEFAATDVVLATGAWTPRLKAMMGIKLPIQPGKGYSITMERPEVCPVIPLIFPECKVAVTPFASSYRIGSTMEFAGYDERISQPRLDLLMQGARAYVRGADQEQGIRQRWFGWRPMTIDGLPYIGSSPRHPRIWVAAGHSMLGLSMAPGTGKLLAQLIVDERPCLDPKAYELGRPV